MTVLAGGPECPGGHTTGAWRLVVLLRALALPTRGPQVHALRDVRGEGSQPLADALQ